MLRRAPARPVFLERGELKFHTGRDSTPVPSRCSSLQEMALVLVLLGSLRAEKLACPYAPTEVAITVAGLLKASWGEWNACLRPSSGRPSSPPKPQSDIVLTSAGKCS